MISFTPYDEWFRADSLARSLGAGASASFAQQALGFLRGLALAWLMPADQYGLLGIALLVVNVLLPICSAGLYEGIARFTPRHENACTLPLFLRHTARLLLLICVPVCGLLLVAARPLGAAVFGSPANAASPATVSNPAGLMASVSLCCLTLAPYQSLVSLLRALRMFRAAGMAEFFAAATFTALAIGATLLGIHHATGLMIAYALSNVATTALFLPGVLRSSAVTARPPPGVDHSSADHRGLLAFSAWAAAGAVVWHGFYYYPAWHLLRLTDEAVVGAFHAVRMIGQLLLLAGVVGANALSSMAVVKWDTDERAAGMEVLQIHSGGALVALLVMGAALCVFEPVLLHLLPATFGIGRAAFGPMLTFFVLTAAIRVIGLRAHLLKLPGIMLLAWLGGSITTVVAAVLWMGSPLHGASLPPEIALQRTAWCAVGGTLVALAIMILLLARHECAPGRVTTFLCMLALPLALGWGGAIATIVLAAYAVRYAITGRFARSAPVEPDIIDIDEGPPC